MHSVCPHDLKRHLLKCNQRPIILGPFHRPGCNSGEECDNHQDYSTIFQDFTDRELQEFVVRLEKIHDDLVRAPQGNTETQPECLLANADLTELGHRNRKHLEQIGSLIAQLAQLDLLRGDNCFVEMGAGRGQLSHELHACVKQESTVHFALIERDHQRYRFDAHHRLEKHGPSFERYRLDIRDLYLPELPSIKDAEPPADVVIVSKHLCGSATDLALRCAMNAQEDMGRVRAIIIALCCYHRLMWNDYVGKEFFRRMNLTPKDFSLIRALTCWCTSENRHRMPQDGKRSTIGKPRRRELLVSSQLSFRWSVVWHLCYNVDRSIDLLETTSILHRRARTHWPQGEATSRLGSHWISTSARIRCPSESLRIEECHTGEHCTDRHTSINVIFLCYENERDLFRGFFANKEIRGYP